MTKRERAAAAAKWRRIARAFERVRRDRDGYGHTHIAFSGLCFAARRVFGGNDLAIGRFGGAFHRRNLWPNNREGDDCRVIAAGLIAAMYETGEFG